MTALRRMEPVTTAPPELIEILEQGGVGPDARDLFEVLAHHPKLMKRFNVFAGGLLARGLVPARERELVILRTGFQCHSAYEFGQHSVTGMSNGITEREIKEVTWPIDATSFTPDEQALLHMVDELCASCCITNETWKALVKRWSDAQMVELMLVAGFYSMVAGLLNSTGVEARPDAPGWP